MLSIRKNQVAEPKRSKKEIAKEFVNNHKEILVVVGVVALLTTFTIAKIALWVNDDPELSEEEWEEIMRHAEAMDEVTAQARRRK